MKTVDLRHCPLPEKPGWTMPDWMEPFRPNLDRECGWYSVEELMNDRETIFINVPHRIANGLACASLVSLLNQLHQEGRLIP